MTEVYSSADMLCELPSPVTEATDSGLKCLLTCSYLEGPACCLSTTN